MTFRFLDFVLLAERRELVGPDGVVALQPQAFALLLFLVENSDRVVTKSEIFRTVWQGRIVGDSTLNARMNAVRKALGDDGARQSVIRTLPRQGFRFLAEITTQASDSTAATSSDKSIGVLPFIPIGEDRDQEYFADGLTEDLITGLCKVPDLYVISRNTSFSFKGAVRNTTQIANEMGVAHLLEGSERQIGDRIRINVRLVNAEQSTPVWAERYDRETSDIFAVQDEITSKITTALKVTLLSRSEVNKGGSAEAYALCMRARALFFHFDPAALTKCLALLDKAVTLEPGYARAWAEQVFPYQNAYAFGFDGFDDGLRIAIERGQKAITIDPYSGFALSRLGFALTMSGRHDEALRTFEKAIELEPQNTDVLAWYCEALNFAGQPDKAIEVAETCMRYDPIAPPNVLHHLAHAHYLSGKPDKAIELEPRVLQVVPSFLPSHMLYAAALIETDRVNDAKKEMRTLFAGYPTFDQRHLQDRFPNRNGDQQTRISNALSTAGLT